MHLVVDLLSAFNQLVGGLAYVEAHTDHHIEGALGFLRGIDGGPLIELYAHLAEQILNGARGTGQCEGDDILLEALQNYQHLGTTSIRIPASSIDHQLSRYDYIVVQGNPTNCFSRGWFGFFEQINWR